MQKKTVVAAIIVPGTKETRTFETMTADLLALSDWLTTVGVTHVAMESTGEYWKPVFNILENNFEEVLLVNAQHIKSVPGRKTDVKDAEWIADLLRHGLLKASFIPLLGSANCGSRPVIAAPSCRKKRLWSIVFKKYWRARISNWRVWHRMWWVSPVGPCWRP